MGSSNGLWLMMVLIMVTGLASSNEEQDRAECGEQLVGLSTCLPYVGGEAKAPTPECCSGLKQVVDKSMKCLCILIKDRNDPKLGLKVNATLAATLPSSCHSPFNLTKCIDLLHLAPKSADAEVFEEYANSASGKSISGPAALTNTGSSSGNIDGSSAEAKSDGGGRKDSLALKIVCGAFLWVMTCNWIFHV
ncbi:protein YLS3 [Tripterygium wilfordii]|uniref:Protein YLS3 n=1 Tax=Tripterygium wilfordii TaxID=458696 RepID=A0A7J7CNQ8_TRIWF|nr:non-specific lipid transfer protein GPI-anchored 13-like [Tripterygium wilfordii]KAF5735717.1 protein YLS3 [Tripterygium wilfordii]